MQSVNALGMECVVWGGTHLEVEVVIGSQPGLNSVQQVQKVT